MFPNLSEDLRRYGTPWQRVRAILFAPRVWAIVSCRFRHWLQRVPAILCWPLKILFYPKAIFIDIATSIELPSQVSIGPGLFIPHAGYIVVASNVKIGRHCTLTQGVTIGHRGGGNEASFASPVIGDRVYIGPGAVVLGPINIGDDVVIGANAVVTHSVPARSVVVGNPARVISVKGSFELVSYVGMESDPERAASLSKSELALTGDVSDS